MKEVHKFTKEDELQSIFTSICDFQQSVQSGFVPLSDNSTTSSTKENLLESNQSHFLRRAEAVRDPLMPQQCLRTQAAWPGQNRTPGVNMSCVVPSKSGTPKLPPGRGCHLQLQQTCTRRFLQPSTKDLYFFQSKP